jgi:hypothetical protein
MVLSTMFAIASPQQGQTGPFFAWIWRKGEQPIPAECGGDTVRCRITRFTTAIPRASASSTSCGPGMPIFRCRRSAVSRSRTYAARPVRQPVSRCASPGARFEAALLRFGFEREADEVYHLSPGQYTLEVVAIGTPGGSQAGL